MLRAMMGASAIDAASASNGVIASRIYAQAEENEAVTSDSSAAISMPLPRNKPTTADVFVDALGGRFAKG